MLANVGEGHHAFCTAWKRIQKNASIGAFSQIGPSIGNGQNRISRKGQRSCRATLATGTFALVPQAHANTTCAVACESKQQDLLKDVAICRVTAVITGRELQVEDSPKFCIISQDQLMICT